LEFDLKALPYGVRKIVEVLGVEQAINVLQEYQGQLFFIPEYPKPQHVVVQVFGQALADYWADLMPKQHYQVPMVDKVLMQIRNQRICQELDNKTSTIQQLVRRYHITRQQITNIYREHDANKKQLGLLFE
jgi:Mor family transcriptional regulator